MTDLSNAVVMWPSGHDLRVWRCLNKDFSRLIDGAPVVWGLPPKDMFRLIDGVPVAKPKPAETGEIEPPARQDGLFTMREAAAHLNVTDEQLAGFLGDGALSYINVGRGKLRPRIRFTKQDLDAFIEQRRQREASCPSTRGRTARSITTTSSSKVIGFAARRNELLAKKRKPSKP
jgi:hypothetical protein